MTGARLNTAQSAVLSILQKAWRDHSVAGMSAVQIADAIPDRSTHQIRKAIGNLVTRKRLLSYDGPDRGYNNVAIKLYSLPEILEKATSPEAPQNEWVESEDSVSSNPDPAAFNESKETNFMAAGKPRQGTIEYEMMKRDEAIQRLMDALEKSVDNFQRSVNRVDSFDPMNAIKEFTRLSESARKQDWGAHREALHAIADTVQRIYDFNNEVHQKTADMIDHFSDADAHQNQGFERGFKMGYKLGREEEAKQNKLFALAMNAGSAITEDMEMEEPSGPPANKSIPRQIDPSRMLKAFEGLIK